VIYDDETELYRYVYRNYYSHGGEKYIRYLKYEIAEDEGIKNIHKKAIGQDFAEIKKLIGGMKLETAIPIIGKEMLRKNPDLYVQRCPKCNKVVQTPLAEQCLWCGHEWRGQNPLRTEYESRNRT